MGKKGLLLLMTLACQCALAGVAFRADVGVGNSDNIRRVDVDETDETIGAVGLDLIWLENSRRLRADVEVNGEYLHYRNDTFDDEFVGFADGEMILGIVPERLTWLLQDAFGQAQSDPFSPTTPETRENINYFATGPDVVVNAGAENSMRFFGRYSQTDYERSLLDAERTGAGIVLARQLSSQSQFALQGVEERTRFDDVPRSDYDRRNAFATYDMRGARTHLGVEAGYSWITRQDDSKMSGPLARIEMTRTMSAASRLSVALETQLSDASQTLRGSVDSGPMMGGGGVTSTPDPFENRSVDVGWSFYRNRTGFDARASWNEDRYEAQTATQLQSDLTRWVYALNLFRRFTAATSAGLSATWTDSEFAATGLTSEELQVAGTLDWQFGRHVGLSLRAEHYRRATSTGLTEYRENRGFVTLFYRHGEAGAR